MRGPEAPGAGKAGGLRWGVPTTVSRGCARAAIIFAELARPRPHGGVPHSSSCDECAGTVERRKKNRKGEMARQAVGCGRALQRPLAAPLPGSPLRTAPRPLASREWAPARRLGRAVRLAVHPPWAGVLPRVGAAQSKTLSHILSDCRRALLCSLQRRDHLSRSRQAHCGSQPPRSGRAL